MHARIQLIKDFIVIVPVLSAGAEKFIHRAVWDGIGRAPCPLDRSFKGLGSSTADTDRLNIVWLCAGRWPFQNRAGCRLFHNFVGCRLS